MSEILLVILVLVFLFGSISLAIPSKSSRKISKLRMNAKMLGCNVTSTIFGKNSFKNKKSFDVSYQIKNQTKYKEGHFVRDKDQLFLYSPVKLKYQNEYEQMVIDLNNTSKYLEEIIFSNRSISFLWHEKEGISTLKNILKKLNNL